MIIANTCSKGAFTNYLDKSLAFLTTYLLVYDQNHYFGLGPIQKPKPELAYTFAGVHKVPSFGYHVFGTIPNFLSISGSDRKSIVRDL